jgi:hypothetical protein
LKSGSLKLLEPSGPVQAFNGTALPLPTNHRAMENIRDSSRWQNFAIIYWIMFVVLGPSITILWPTTDGHYNFLRAPTEEEHYT